MTFYVDLLREQGVRLPYPYSSAITTSRWAMRELRVQSGGRPLRVLYIFDPDRQAILILGDDRFYAENVPNADALYAEYHAAVVKQKAAETAAAKRQGGKKKGKK